MTRRFPGVDPFLEDPAFWRDFHESFIIYARDAISGMLPDSYDVRIDERINLMGASGQPDAQILPDLTLSRDEQSALWSSGASGTAPGVAEPVTIPVMMLDEERESFLEIIHRPTRELVTVLELLSPTNKTGAGYHDYLTKRNSVLREPVHLVELDFLLGGKRLPMRRALPPGECFAIVSRHHTRPDAEVYAWSLRVPLTAIRIPLRAPDPDLILNLAAIYEETFRRGRYERSLRYGQPLQAPLPPAAAEWIAARAGGAGT